jgi:parallel beta-helix repeat protein/putative cofactor-binding repeat protein
VITASSYGSLVKISTNEPSAAVLNGFTIQGASGTTANYPIAGILISGSSPTITNNVVQQNIGCGIAVVQGASPTIQGNDIRRNRARLAGEQELTGSCGAVAGTGLYINGGATVTVTGNIIEENSVIGGLPSVYGTNGAAITAGFTRRLVLMNNIVRNNIGFAQDGLDYGLTDTGPDTLVMVQNLFYTDSSASASTDSQVYVGGAFQPPYPTVIEINNSIYGSEGFQGTYAAGSIIDNSIFDDWSPKSEGGIVCIAGAQTAPLTIGNNDIVPPTRSLPDEPGGCPLGAANISLDPQFIASGSGNFHVQRSSPVIAAGDITAPMIPAADLAGKNRTVCGTIDMGVYEVHPQPATVVTSSNNPSVGGTSVTFTAQVPGNCNIPTGTVTFMDGANALGTVALSAGASATLTTSSLTVGTHIITVTYPGDFNFDASTSAPLTQVVTGYPTSTTLTVTPDPADAFAPIQLSSTVSSQFGKPTGSVVFTAGATTLATAPLNGSGNASVTIATLGAGTYNIVATYSADTNFAASSSPIVIEKVIGADSAVTLTASPNPTTYGQTVTFKAQARPAQGNSVPTGSMVFSDGATALGSVSLDSTGAASLNIATLGVGVHTITASYSGSGNFNPSSATTNETITAFPTTLTLTASPNPAALGQSVTIVATSAASSHAPSGTVTFSDHSGTLGSAPLVAGIASLTTATLPVGSHQIIATLNPTGPYAPSVSTAISELVTAYDFSLTDSSTSVTIPGNDLQILSVTVTPIAGFPRAVTLTCAPVPLNAECVFAQTTTTPLSAGPQTVKLTVSTSSLFGYGHQVSALAPLHKSRKGGSAALAGLLLPILALGLKGKSAGRCKERSRHILFLTIIATLSLGLSACSGRLPLPTPPGNYVLTITANDTDPSTGLTHSVNLNLKVPE